MKKKVQIDANLEKLVPIFLKSRKEDIVILKELVESEDYQGFKMLGHKCKGAAASYGFNYIADLGKEIEKAAQNKDLAKIKGLISNYENYIEDVEIEYVKLEQ